MLTFWLLLKLTQKFTPKTFTVMPKPNYGLLKKERGSAFKPSLNYPFSLQVLSILVMWPSLPPGVVFCCTFPELIQLSNAVRSSLFLLLLSGYFPCCRQGRKTIPTWEWQPTRSGEAVLEPMTTTSSLSMVLIVANYYWQIKNVSCS